MKRTLLAAVTGSCLVAIMGPAPAWGQCGLGNGDCCSANDTSGCDDVGCCEAVCSIDVFCCEVAWDDVCADVAAEICPICLPTSCPSPDDCCSPHGTPGCEDTACCESVCASDPLCCDVAWDSICADEANADPACSCEDCPGLCLGDLNGDGVVDSEDLGLLNLAWCLDGVDCDPCADLNDDGFVNEADLTILLGAWGSCPAGVCPGEGDCCEANGTPGCVDIECCEMVCGIESFCCDIQWDAICADVAQELCENCPGCGDVFAGSCCEANASPYCDDEACCDIVCGIEPYCCSIEWDSSCASTATALCDSCVPVTEYYQAIDVNGVPCMFEGALSESGLFSVLITCDDGYKYRLRLTPEAMEVEHRDVNYGSTIQFRASETARATLFSDEDYVQGTHRYNEIPASYQYPWCGIPHHHAALLEVESIVNDGGTELAQVLQDLHLCTVVGSHLYTPADIQRENQAIKTMFLQDPPQPPRCRHRAA